MRFILVAEQSRGEKSRASRNRQSHHLAPPISHRARDPTTASMSTSMSGSSSKATTPAPSTRGTFIRGRSWAKSMRWHPLALHVSRSSAHGVQGPAPLVVDDRQRRSLMARAMRHRRQFRRPRRGVGILGRRMAADRAMHAASPMRFRIQLECSCQVPRQAR